MLGVFTEALKLPGTQTPNSVSQALGRSCYLGQFFSLPAVFFLFLGVSAIYIQLRGEPRVGEEFIGRLGDFRLLVASSLKGLPLPFLATLGVSKSLL